jgi:hypothetical protein
MSDTQHEDIGVPRRCDRDHHPARPTRIALPKLSDVRDGVADYREAVAEAQELNGKIRRTDDLIDEIVYDLYGLTDEEIEIVEDAVGS